MRQPDVNRLNSFLLQESELLDMCYTNASNSEWDEIRSIRRRRRLERLDNHGTQIF